MLRVGLLYSRIRVEEKLPTEEFNRNPFVAVVRINNGTNFDITLKPVDVDIVVERSVSYSRGLYLSRIFEANGVSVFNPSYITEHCRDTYITSQLLAQNRLPTLRVLMAFDPQAAL